MVAQIGNNIVAISMMYATKKVKKDNILDAIREENI